MTKSTKSNSKSGKSSKPEKTSAKAESKKGSRIKDETSQVSEEEQTPATIYAAAITEIEELLGSVKDKFKVIKGLAKKLGKRVRKAGTLSPNNAFTRQMGIPVPLITLLRNPDDNKKLSKKSTLSRTQLLRAINNYCKKAELGQGSGFYKPDEPLREALLMKKKETFNAAQLQKIISTIYKHYEIVPTPIETAAASGTTKKSKRQLAEDESESDNVRSEESEKPKSRKRSNA